MAMSMQEKIGSATEWERPSMALVQKGRSSLVQEASRDITFTALSEALDMDADIYKKAFLEALEVEERLTLEIDRQAADHKIDNSALLEIVRSFSMPEQFGVFRLSKKEGLNEEHEAKIKSLALEQYVTALAAHFEKLEADNADPKKYIQVLCDLQARHQIANSYLLSEKNHHGAWMTAFLEVRDRYLEKGYPNLTDKKQVIKKLDLDSKKYGNDKVLLHQKDPLSYCLCLLDVDSRKNQNGKNQSLKEAELQALNYLLTRELFGQLKLFSKLTLKNYAPLWSAWIKKNASHLVDPKSPVSKLLNYFWGGEENMPTRLYNALLEIRSQSEMVPNDHLGEILNALFLPKRASEIYQKIDREGRPWMQDILRIWEKNSADTRVEDITQYLDQNVGSGDFLIWLTNEGLETTEDDWEDIIKVLFDYIVENGKKERETFHAKPLNVLLPQQDRSPQGVNLDKYADFILRDVIGSGIIDFSYFSESGELSGSNQAEAPEDSSFTSLSQQKKFEVQKQNFKDLLWEKILAAPLGKMLQNPDWIFLLEYVGRIDKENLDKNPKIRTFAVESLKLFIATRHYTVMSFSKSFLKPALLPVWRILFQMYREEIGAEGSIVRKELLNFFGDITLLPKELQVYFDIEAQTQGTKTAVDKTLQEEVEHSPYPLVTTPKFLSPTSVGAEFKVPEWPEGEGVVLIAQQVRTKKGHAILSTRDIKNNPLQRLVFNQADELIIPACFGHDVSFYFDTKPDREVALGAVKVPYLKSEQRTQSPVVFPVSKPVPASENRPKKTEAAKPTEVPGGLLGILIEDFKGQPLRRLINPKYETKGSKITFQLHAATLAEEPELLEKWGSVEFEYDFKTRRITKPLPLDPELIKSLNACFEGREDLVDTCYQSINQSFGAVTRKFNLYSREKEKGKSGWFQEFRGQAGFWWDIVWEKGQPMVQKAISVAQDKYPGVKIKPLNSNSNTFPGLGITANINGQKISVNVKPDSDGKLQISSEDRASEALARGVFSFIALELAKIPTFPGQKEREKQEKSVKKLRESAYQKLLQGKAVMLPHFDEEGLIGSKTEVLAAQVRSDDLILLRDSSVRFNGENTNFDATSYETVHQELAHRRNLKHLLWRLIASANSELHESKSTKGREPIASKKALGILAAVLKETGQDLEWFAQVKNVDELIDNPLKISGEPWFEVYLKRLEDLSFPLSFQPALTADVAEIEFGREALGNIIR